MTPPYGRFPSGGFFGKAPKLLAIFAMILAGGDRALSAEFRMTGLRCEGSEDPVGIDESRPRLSWWIEADGRDRRQSAWQVLVATSRDRLETGKADLWDSGRVESDGTMHMSYGGRPLVSSQRVYWRGQVWDEDGRPSGWSATGSWRMGILAEDDWKARWIGYRGEGIPVFRHRFDLGEGVGVRDAVVHVCGLGHFDLFLDGRKVGNHFLDPAWSVYEKTVYYSSFDVTEVLGRGPHALAVMLGKGFYNTVGDRRIHGVKADRPLRLRLQLEITMTDGTRRVIATDESWKCTSGPITHSAILGGEDHDARRLPPNWMTAAFDDTGWATAEPGSGPGGRLVAALAPPMVPLDVFRPVSIDEPEPGVFVYDFGQNASAVPRLRARGSAGRTIKLVPAEQRHGMTPRRNDGRGRVNQAGVGTPNWFAYTLRGEGIEEWTPQFSYGGFQYLEVEGAVPAGRPNPEGRPVVEELVSVHVRSAARPAGRFECSNPSWNDIDRLVSWAVRGNLAHVLTDCPHREKLGWLEVSYLMGPSIAGRFDVERFYRKVARDCVDSQGADGRVPTVAPSFPAFEGGFAYTPEWGAAAVLNPWIHYEWYGDRRVLEENFATMKSFVDFMERTSREWVPVAGLGDWYDYGHGKPLGASQFTPPELTAMATFGRCATIVGRTAEVLGRTAEARSYRALAERIAAAFRGRWFDGRAEFTNRGSPQTANAMALVCDLAPEEARGAVLGRIEDDLRSRGNQQTSGDIGFWYLWQALARAGRSDLVADMVHRTDMGSYGFIVRNGWTSMPEAWDADTGASMNHCMLGHIQEWFFGWVAGIRPDPAGPGFEAFIIDPHPPSGLEWARGRYESNRGPVASEWERTPGGGLRLAVTIPANTRARVRLPARRIEDVREGGEPVSAAIGVRVEGIRPEGIDLRVGSGTYRFEVTGR